MIFISNNSLDFGQKLKNSYFSIDPNHSLQILNQTLSKL